LSSGADGGLAAGIPLGRAGNDEPALGAAQNQVNRLKSLTINGEKTTPGKASAGNMGSPILIEKVRFRTA